jgi:hypothetical protein
MKRRAPKGEPHVAIFWVVSGNALIDSTPLSQAEPYVDFLIHAGGHDKVWQRYQQSGLVAADMEYEESPRGRVMYNTETQRFTLLADKCILKNNGVVKKIMSAMNLPSKTTDKGTDEHYQCSACPPARWE